MVLFTVLFYLCSFCFWGLFSQLLEVFLPLLFPTLICKMTESIVTFCLAESGLKHVHLACLALFATQSLNWMVSLWMFKPSFAITLVQEKRKICRVLILLYVWTQSKVLLFKHKVQMFTLELCIILIKTQSHAFEPLPLSHIKWNLKISANGSLFWSIANFNKHAAG